jgi:hypothetical protein
MTITSATTKVSYSANGSTTVFAYSFKIFADADLKVIIRAADGVETTKTLTTHYTVSGAGSTSGGNVTFTSGNTPANGETVVIKRELALTQSTDYVANDPFPAESHEDALDRLTMIAQQQAEETGRTLVLPETDTGSATIPSSTTRANKYLSFDSNGDLTVTAQTSDASVDVVEDTTPQLGGNLDANTKNIVFGDSGSASDDRLTFGAGTDVSVYWDGTDGHITALGTLNIDGADGHEMAKFVDGGAVELYHNDSKKLETTSSGATVTGTLAATLSTAAQANITSVGTLTGLTLSGNVALTSDDPTITMTDSSGTNDIVTLQSASGALTITTRDGSADGQIIFKKNDGSATDETMRINGSGHVGIGTDSPTQALHVDEPTSNNYAAVINSSLSSFQGAVLRLTSVRTTTDSSFNFFLCGSDKMAIRDSGNVVNANNSYGAFSDSRIKENIVDASSQWNDIKALKVRKYNLIGSTLTQIGVVAQEVEAAGMSGLVDEAKLSEPDADGNDVIRKNVKYSVLYVKAIKALQEAMTRIETLETKVAALES